MQQTNDLEDQDLIDHILYKSSKDMSLLDVHIPTQHKFFSYGAPHLQPCISDTTCTSQTSQIVYYSSKCIKPTFVD